jgi:hypothetical protein
MVAHPLPMNDESAEILDAQPVLNNWVRGSLLGIAGGLLTVFGIALWLNPYKDGRTWQMETHRQLGLPPCTFKVITARMNGGQGLPCPSCGMTTSFALLVRGDVWNSLRANAVGTLLAVFCLAMIPWSLASAYWKRPLFIVSIEQAFLRVLVVFVLLMLTRWFIVLALIWWHGAG